MTVDSKKYKFEVYENPSSGSRAVSCRLMDGRAERHDDTGSRFSQLLF
jgi:hypothetical protein